MKRIRLTIEWDGACSEHDWARSCTEVIEKHDLSRVTKVIETELLTALGTTPVRKDIRHGRMSFDQHRAEQPQPEHSNGP